MIYILAGIVGINLLICIAGAAEWVWDKLDPPAEKKEAAPVAPTTEAARWNRFYTPVSTSTITECGGKRNASL